MSVIETTAPIELENLKKYFENKDTKFIIDYEKSELKNDKLLTYLANLDLPCDVKNYDEDFVLTYLKFQMIVNVPSLELQVINMLTQLKNGLEVNFKEELLQWERKIDSMALFNMYTINTKLTKDFIKEFPEDDTQDTSGINFVSLFKHKSFYSLFEKIDTKNLTNFSSYFNDYMFKGNNLFSFWANENNPMFLLTWGISVGEMEKLKEAV